MPLETLVLDSVEASAERFAEWDALAVRARRPTCAPAWGLAWWRHAAPRGAGLRLILVSDGEQLVGVAPFYFTRGPLGPAEYGLLAGEITARVEPLAWPGRDEEVAAAVARALADIRPRPGLIRFRGVPVDAPWLRALRGGWPAGRAAYVHVDPPIPAPTVTLDGTADVEEWLGTRSSNFRQQVRRARRKLEKAGAEFRTASSVEELDRDLQAFERLHNLRWDDRGGSAALVEGVDAMLREAGRELLESGRFRLDSIDLDGKTISSQLYLAAGGEVTYWLGGFDDDYGSLKPSIVALVAAVGDSLQRGDERFDLGPGDQDYKYRLADGEEALAWVTLVPPGRGYARGRAALAPVQARRALAERLPDDARERVKKLLRG